MFVICRGSLVFLMCDDPTAGGAFSLGRGVASGSSFSGAAVPGVWACTPGACPAGAPLRNSPQVLLWGRGAPSCREGTFLVPLPELLGTLWPGDIPRGHRGGVFERLPCGKIRG